MRLPQDEPESEEALSEITSFEPERHVNQTNHDGDFHQRPNHGGESCARVDAEHRNSNRDGEFEIVARRRKRQGCCLRVVGSAFSTHPKTYEKHHDKVDQQGDSNTHHIHRQLDNHIPFEAEHYDDGEEQGNQSQWTNRRYERALIPVPPLGTNEEKARQHSRYERNAQIDEDAFRNLRNPNVYNTALHAYQRREQGEKHP